MSKVLIIYTGGTIGMKKDYDSGSLVPFDFAHLIEHIPELSHLDCELKVITLSLIKDSSDIGLNEWLEMSKIIETNYTQFDGFVVLHGSDTMSYSSSAMSFLLQQLDKPVIFTGSQLPIGDLRTDAKENLISAIQLALLQKDGVPVIQEVGLYFEYKLYRANRTTKINTEHFKAFESPNYPVLVDSGLHMKINHPSLWRKKEENSHFSATQRMCDEVVLCKLFPGFNPNYFESYLGAYRPKVLILETFGSGNAPRDKHFLDQIASLIQSGIHIVNVTQCIGGGVMMGYYENSLYLKDLGVISGKDITTESAITKSMFLLAENLNRDDFERAFHQSLCGEISE